MRAVKVGDLVRCANEVSFFPGLGGKVLKVTQVSSHNDAVVCGGVLLWSYEYTIITSYKDVLSEYD